MGSGKKNKTAQALFLMKTATTGELTTVAASKDDPPSDADSEGTKEGNDAWDAFLNTEIEEVEPTEEEKEEIKKISSGLQGYLEQIEEPFLYNESGGKENDKIDNNGINPVVSYNDFLGPFTINWDETNSDREYSDIKDGGELVAVSKLTKITINYLDGDSEVLDIENNENTSGIEIIQDGKTFKEPYKIKSNKPFNIKNPNLDREVSGIEIHLKKQARFKTATFTIYMGDEALPDQAALTAALEQYLIDNGYKPIEGSVTATVESIYTPQDNIKTMALSITGTAELDLPINVIIKKGDIELTKKGIYNEEENAEQQEEKLKDVRFAVYCDQVGKFVKDIKLRDGTTDSYKIEFTDNIEEAKAYYTDENGVILIENLFAGEGRTDADGNIISYTYKLVELYDENNKNSYYIDPIKIETATSNYSSTGSDNSNEAHEDTAIKPGHWPEIKNGDEPQYCTIENITVYFDDGYTVDGQQGQRIKTYIIIEDDRTSGDLVIEKVDETKNEIKLAGTEFKIRLIKSEDVDDEHNLGEANKWLGKVEKNADGVYDYSDLMHDEYLIDGNPVDDDRIATFVADENGMVKINCIINGEYQIYEVKAAEGYNIERQDKYGADPNYPNWVAFDPIKISTKNNKIQLTLDHDNALENRKIVSSIEGNIWEDIEALNKKELEDKYNSLRDEGENSLDVKDDIEVYLKDQQGNEIARTTTNADANYHWSISKWAIAPEGRNYEREELNTDIYYWDLVNAYVEFRYNNREYISVNPFVDGADQVENNSKAQEYLLTESELDDTNLTGVNDNQPGYAVTKINAIEAGTTSEEIIRRTWRNYDLDKLGLTGYYNTNNFKVENINLGLWRKHKPTYDIQETLQYSKIIMNGYTYTYNYYKTESDGSETPTGLTSDMVPSTYPQVGAKVYGAKVYPSDIAYTAGEQNKDANKPGMEMYVVYKIAVTNTTVTHIPFIHDEVRLYVTELTNEYDSSKFEISSAHQGDKNWEGSAYFDLWSKSNNADTQTKPVGGENNNLANYEIDGDGDNRQDSATGVPLSERQKLSDGIKPGETDTVYIQFKVTQAFLEKVLAQDLEEENYNAISVARSIAHHAYLRTDNVWNKGNGAVENPRDVENGNVSADYYKDSRDVDKSDDPKDFLHRTEDDQHEAGALGLMFMLGEERTISGTVFEDFDIKENAETNTNLGNGKIDNDETNRAKGVKVELIDASKEENGSENVLANLYQKDVTNNVGYVIKSGEDTIQHTDENGAYKFVGVVPGVYRIRFTYPDGTTIMKDGNDTNITSNDYKSTILNIEEAGETIRTANEKTREEMIEKTSDYIEYITGKIYATSSEEEETAQRIVEWYKYLFKETPNIQYNIATDNFDEREHFETYEYTIDGNPGEPGEYPPVMHSNSPYFSISVENDIKDLRDVDEPDDNNIGGTGTYGHRPEYQRFNFGLIKTTVTDITLDKIISDVKLTTSSGTTLVQGSPKDALNYVTALDQLAEGSKYVRVEMALEDIYGTSLETTYKITITNRSDKDYIELPGNAKYGYYFKYGDRSAAYLVQTTVTEVIDGLDPDYNLLDDPLAEIVFHPEESRPAGDEKYEVKATPRDHDLILTEWTPIETGGYTQVEYTASGTFREEMDLTYDNDARITKMKLDKAQALRTGYISWGDSSTSRLVITPDTGEDRRPIYYIAGAIALIILATGIVVVKNGILKKEE